MKNHFVGPLSNYSDQCLYCEEIFSTENPCVNDEGFIFSDEFPKSKEDLSEELVRHFTIKKTLHLDGQCQNCRNEEIRQEIDAKERYEY